MSEKTVSNKDASVIEQFVVEELAATILELSDIGPFHGAVGAVGPIDAPLAGFRVVEAQACIGQSSHRLLQHHAHTGPVQIRVALVIERR
jgi:hypothetical protein